MRILIADDDDAALDLLRLSLTQAGHEVEAVRDGRQALEKLQSGLFRLVISDWGMPQMSGIELCRAIRTQPCAGYIYMILLTCRTRTDDVVEGLDAGADDFITKPFNPAELLVRVRAGERVLSLASRDVTIFSLAKLTETRDADTGAHLERIREYCRVIAQHLSAQDKFRGEVSDDYVQMIYETSPLHDIGKVGIPDCVLGKPGRLSDREFQIMKRHTEIGAEALDAAARQYPDAAFLRMASAIALTHHEHYDGTGYPAGLSGEEIPLCGRIIALADVYDALRARRVYKDAFGHDVACSIILKGSGSHFDPDVVEAFVENEQKFDAIHQSFSEEESAPPLEQLVHAVQ